MSFHRLRPHTAKILLAALAVALPGPVGGQVADAWSELYTWRATGNLASQGGTPEGWYLAPIHANLLPDGRILLIAMARQEEHPQEPWVNAAHVAVMEPDFDADADGQVWLDQVHVPLECSAAVSLVGHAEADHGDEPIPSDTVPGDPWSAYPAGAGCGTPEVLFDDHVGCSGHTFLADGRLFIAGGTRRLVDAESGDRLSTWGLPYSVLFDPATDAWQRIEPWMEGDGELGRPLRWYPTATRLHDGRILVTAGFERVDTMVTNLSVEIWDAEAPVESPYTVLSPHAATPAEIYNPNYSHVFLLPEPLSGGGRSWDLVIIGAPARPVLLSLDPALDAARRWAVWPDSRPGTVPAEDANRSASSALLPLRLIDGEHGWRNGAVAMAGGDGTAADQLDIFDPAAARWSPSLDLRVDRAFPSLVLLPDLNLLVVAGSNEDDADGGEERALYVDPLDGFRLLGGSKMGESRGYHTVTVLLADGRVLVGSGQTFGGYEGKPEQPTFRIYSPPYVGADRPTITDAPASFGYGSEIEVGWQGNGLAEAELLALPSQTHSIDMNQRLIQLEIVTSDAAAGTATLRAPTGARLAPPGDYLLMLLDDDRVPSAGRPVQLVP